MKVTIQNNIDEHDVIISKHRLTYDSTFEVL
jgi:hypothetical protein